MPSNVLMHDCFDSLRPGPIAEAVNGPFREMHSQPASPDDNLGGWSRQVGYWSLPDPLWQLVETPQGRFVESLATATVYDNISLAKGDPDWQDVTVETTVTLLPPGQGGWGGPAGLIFRFQDTQRYYAAIVDEDGFAKILMRVDHGWDTLAAAPVQVPVGGAFTIRAEAAGPHLKASIAGVDLQADNGVLACGCVGFIGARPARFGSMTVTALPGETDRLARRKRDRETRLTAKRTRHGRPVPWRKYDTKGFGSGRRIRLGDLDGDGHADFLLLQIGSQKDKTITCMTALSSRGDVLWQKGTPSPAPRAEASGDGPCQIHDIDGDGRNEVVCVWENQLTVLDGATGQTKYQAPLPSMQPLPDLLKQNILHWGAGYNDEGPTVVPAAILFADLKGRGARRDALLADPYHTLVAMDPQFRELWRTVNSHGHFPQPYDFDNDGRDDVLAGYRRVSPDGNTLGKVNLQDHQDAIYCGPLDTDGTGPIKILMAAGEDGLLTLTPDYDIRQRVMGHVQRLAIGRFREDLPGLCIATVLFHGNPGIISLFDSTVKKVWTRNFPVLGATLQPVNWDGTGIELMLLSGIRPSQGYQGGLLDGHGDLVVPLPDDGGPGFCAFAHDFDNDGLDELMLWDHDRIWIYHNENDPPAGLRYQPLRPPLYNMSNFQCYWSRPRWIG